MKFWSRYAFSALAIAVFAGVLCVGDVSAQGKIREIKQRMDAFNKGLTTLRSRVTMVKTNAQLGDSDTRVGKVIYAKRPGKDALVRVDWEKPVESLTVKDGQYRMYQPRLNIAYEGSVKNATTTRKENSAFAFMNMSKAQLDANYDVRLLAENVVLSSGARTWHLELIPKTKTSYKTAELWVDTDGMPRQTKIIEQNNDTTTVLLTDFEPNIPLKTSDFEITLAKGTKIQKS